MFPYAIPLRTACLIVAIPSLLACGQQSVPANGVQAHSAQSAPPIVTMDSKPPARPEASMKVLDSTTDHPSPISEKDALRKPEMTLDENGNAILARAQESFSTPTLRGSALTPKDPLFGGREERETFTRELWQANWRPNDPIDVYIILPRHVKKPPVVLYLYGFPTDTDRFKDDRWCDRVTRNGAAAVGIVSALTGQRYVFRPFKEWFVSELPESLATTAHDVQILLTQLEPRQDMDLTRVGIFAQGSGGAIAILAAAADPRIRALDLLDPWGDWPDWFAKPVFFPEREQSNYLQPEFQKKLESLEPLRYLPQLSDRRLRIQFVEENRESAEAVSKLKAATPSNAEIAQFRTGRELYQVNSDGRLFSWITSALHSTPNQQTGRSPVQDAHQQNSQKPE